MDLEAGADDYRAAIAAGVDHEAVQAKATKWLTKKCTELADQAYLQIRPA